ncbi:MAG: leucine-rich repeat domain-containing protein, partial [Clostridiales bacterium]|nr:leucine-rich repeat domain-containing protein [Clostridiales bacterium]
MEKKITVNKKFIAYIVALITALCVMIGAFFGVTANSLESGNTLTAGTVNASANGARDNERVQMIDLFKRYPSNYVIGPIDAASDDVDPETGKYQYKSTNLDINGNPTNNIYGIPADQYLDVESYIYTTGVKDSTEGRTLYGWKPNIRAVLGTGSQKGKLAENGKIMSGSSVTENVGIYATFETGQIFGSTEKYVLIVPSDITRIGTGSAAFVYGGKSYYQDYTSGTTTPSGEAYTDFGCFIYSDAIAHYQEPYFWQPRERLAGIYFPDDSRLTTIDGATYTGSTPTASTAWGTSNRTFKKLSGKGAFERCDSLRFLILPNDLTSIGKHAFFYCNGIVDMNIPKKVTTIGAYAFGTCTSIRVLPRPAIGDNIDSKAYDGCSFEDENTIYIMGGAPTLDADGNKVYDNGLSGFIFKKNGSSWEAKGLSGETGEDKNKVFIFPDSSDFSATSDRRRAVEYDYIDRDGIKTKNSFPDGGVTSYKVGDNFASGKWCQNIIMPKAVTEIGANAFFKSHVKYFETYATKIGSGAFTESENKEGDDSGNQWYYFHQPAGNPTYSIPNGAFVTPNNGVTRHIVFESKSMMDNVGSAFTGLTNLAPTGTVVHYQIPVYANIYSEEATTYNGKGVTLVESDLAERFYYDSDYVELPNIKQGNNTILYTKRLSGFDFASTKQATGGWVNVGEGTKHSKPTLGHMQSTVWYTNTSYTTSTTASDLYNIAMTTPVNIYTKNIAKPQNIFDKTYDGTYQGQFTFGETYTFGDVNKKLGDSDTECIDYNTALGLSGDYVVNLEKFTYANGVAGRTDNTSSLHNAGTYEFSIELNTKWGVWSDKYKADNEGYFDAVAAIARKQIDYSTLDKLPQFVNAGSNVALSGATTPIYKYNDGWYIAQKDGEEPNDTKTVTNSFVYYTGSDITIKISGENNLSADASSSTLGDVEIISRNGLSFANSSEYTASFMFQVKYIPGTNNQFSNYIFYYGGDNETKYDNVTDAEKGLSITGKQDNFFRISKRWYIVNQTNMFVNGGTQTPYLPIEGDIHYADNISVNVPELFYGNAADKIDFAIDYMPVSGGRATVIAPRTTMGSAENAIAYYINSSMPAGTYNLKLYGAAVSANVDGEIKSYSAISGEYSINVLPKEFDSETIADIHNVLRGQQVANSSQAVTELEKYINAYPLDNKKLHESVATYITMLNNTIVADRGNATNYWSDKSAYFDTSVTVGYNREGSGNTVYMNESATLGAIGTANTYTFYYSISAKNYATIGGADAPDRQERGFRTTLYTAVKLSDIYNIIVNIKDPYLKDVTYTGMTAQTRVPYSQYYKYSFDDTDYVNVGTRTVTLTLNDPVLARWEPDDNDYSEYLAIVDDGESLRVNFNIVTADNGWNVMPQMSSWTFNGFDKDVNAIIAGLKFDSTVKYALIPNTVTDPLAVEWGDNVDGVAYFTVDENGMVDDATAAKLNALKPASYYLKFFVSEIYAPDGETVNVYAYDDIARNNSNIPMATVTIGKAVNRWTSTPNVMRWTFGDYNSETNLITAEALYPALLPKDENGNDIVGFTYTDGGVALTAAQSKFKFTVYDGTGADVTSQLASLHAGTYTLATSMDASDYYTAIAETRMSFEVAQAVNIWTTTPQVVQWTWGEYSASKNIISAETKFSGGDGSVNSTDKPILFSVLQTVNGTRVVVANLENFQIDANGNITNAVAAEAFAKLNAGNYYLRATKQGNNDYTDITGDATTDISFTVAHAANSWDTQPVITGFVYNQFDAENNFIAGVPHFPLSDKAVYYAIGNSAYANVTTLDDFSAVAGTHFTITDAASINAITAHLSGLGKGTYYFAVFVPADNNYSYLFYAGSFNVSQTSNYWENATPPDISGWTYGTFVDSLFKSGTPIHGEATYTVRYVVDGNVDETDNGIVKIGDTSLNGLSYSELKALLNSLNAGTYSLQASSGSTEDYAEVKASKQFTVAKANNAWQTLPSISGWKYDGTTKTPGNKGIAKYENSEITARYYLTTTDGNGNTVADTSKEFSAVKDAGSYAYVLTLADTTNYNGFTTTLFFTVEKDDNFWVTSPAGTYSWTWGNDITALTNNIVNAEAHNGELSFSIVKTSGDGTYTARTDVSISELLETLPVGKYTITASVTPDGNHVALTAAEAYVEVLAAQLTVNTEPACAGWTWGVADASKVFTDIAVKPAKDSDVVSKAYSLSTDGGESWTANTDVDYAYLLEYLRSSDRNVGEYKIRIVVTCANHESVTRIVTFTIGNASFTWSGEQKNVSWDWDNKWTAGDSGRDIPNLTATDCKGNTVALSYIINGTITYTDFGSVKAYLQSNERTAGDYTVKVSATLANHETSEKTFTVTVAVAENEWTQSLNASYTIEYLAWNNVDWQNLPTPTAMFGDVVCKYGATTIADINEWIKTLGASTEPYVLMLTVDASTGKYTALSKKVEITVVGIGSTWGNHNDLLAAVQGATDIAATYNFTYNKNVFDTIKTDVVLPIGKDAGTTTYALYFNDTLIPAYNTLEGIAEYFSLAGRTAGTYKIVADYEPTDKSYATLQYTVTVNVAKAEVAWDERLDSSYSLTYNSVNVPNPTADKDFAIVTVTVKKSGTDTALDMKGMTLAEFVKTLDVGTYTITATIAESDNYYVNGSRETTSLLYIGAIPNTWKNVTLGDKTITAEQWTDGYTWTFTRGETISVMLPESVIGEVTITFGGTPTSIKTLAELNELLNKDDNGNARAAGRYTLRFVVAATDNYNGLVSNCAVVIDKKSNTWKQQLVSVNTSGSVDTTTFKMPTATVDKMPIDGKGDIDLRLFNIVKAGNTANSDWYTTTAFIDELGKLVNGTYTITVRIGGSAPTNAVDDFKAALELYNADYEEISGSCTVTLSPAVNTWTTKLSNMNWTWGDTVSAVLSVATHGNNTIVYTVSGNGREWVVRTSVYGDDTLAELNTVLGELLPATYTITARIDGTDLYAAPTEVNFALLTVYKYAASWNGYTDEALAPYGLLNMTWKQASNNFLPELTVKYMNEKVQSSKAAVWKIDNDAITGSIIDALNECKVGTYTVTATYDGDRYNDGLTFTSTVIIGKATVAWSSDTVNADRQYTWVLNAETNSTLVQPTLDNAGDCTVTYTLVKVGSAGTLYSGSVWSGANSLSSILATQKAGTYEITATVSGDDNYALPADVTYTLTISTEPNKWNVVPATSLTWTYKGENNQPVAFEPAHNADLMVITVGGQTIRYENLMWQLGYLGVGSYSIVATVPATEEYAGLDAYTVTLTIGQASDSFGTCNVPASWDWDDVSQKTDENGVAWQNTWNTTFTVPVPQVSDIATATVYSGTAEQFTATLHYETVDGVKDVLATDLNALKSKLLGLHVGTYTIEFAVADSANYKGCSVVKTFDVLKVDNSWDGADGMPTIAGWQYNSSVANPTATPVYGKGTVKFSYAQAVGNETEADLMNDDSILTWKDSTETTGGTYWLRAYVPGTSDYNALVGYHQFNINASQNGWVNNPGVIAWDWCGYNKTVNLFSGSAKNNGVATFKIYYGVSGNNRNLALSDFAANGVTLDKTEAWIVNQFCTGGFTLVNDNNVMVVSDDVAKYLNALKPGTYVLSVSVAGDNNYAALNGSATFVVGKAANGWTTGKAPAVSSYTYNNYNATTTFTYGETTYGSASAVIYRLSGTTYDDRAIDLGGNSTSNYTQVQTWLQDLEAGSYTLSAWVAASANGTYSALYSADSPYTTRSFTVARATNSWKNTQLVTQINKAYSEIHATGFDATAFAALYAELLHHNPDATVNYALLNSDYSSRNTDSLTYAQLFNAIKALPAGEYVIRATVAQTNNYLAIAPTDTRLTISTHDNAFTKIPDALTAQWARDNDNNNATVLTDFEVKATYGADTVTYTLGTETYNTYALFKAAVKTLDAGPYNVTITIAGTNEYTGLSVVRMLTVNPADNNWQNGWNVAGSLSVADATTRAGLSWGWRSTVTWTKAVPLYGTTVHVEIRQWMAATNEWYTVQYVTVDYSASNGDSAVAVISDALSKLDVGNYEIIVSAPASGNWTAISNKTEFAVTKVANNWVKAPYITGATDNKWIYGANVIPNAEAKHGAARYEYTTKSGNKLTSMPTEAGEYVIKFIVDDTINYDGISAVLNVT